MVHPNVNSKKNGEGEFKYIFFNHSRLKKIFYTIHLSYLYQFNLRLYRVDQAQLELT